MLKVNIVEFGINAEIAPPPFPPILNDLIHNWRLTINMLAYYTLKYPSKCAQLEQQMHTYVDISTTKGDRDVIQLKYIACVL